jgi:hypothetical protein
VAQALAEPVMSERVARLLAKKAERKARKQTEALARADVDAIEEPASAAEEQPLEQEVANAEPAEKETVQEGAEGASEAAPCNTPIWPNAEQDESEATGKHEEEAKDDLDASPRYEMEAGSGELSTADEEAKTSVIDGDDTTDSMDTQHEQHASEDTFEVNHCEQGIEWGDEYAELDDEDQWLVDKWSAACAERLPVAQYSPPVRDEWMVPFDELVRSPEVARLSYSMQDVTAVAPPAAPEYHPVLTAEGQQLYTNGAEMFVLAAVEALEDRTSTPGVRMTPLMDPSDPVHTMILDVCSPGAPPGESPQVAPWSSDDQWDVCWDAAVM